MKKVIRNTLLILSILLIIPGVYNLILSVCFFDITDLYDEELMTFLTGILFCLIPIVVFTVYGLLNYSEKIDQIDSFMSKLELFLIINNFNNDEKQAILEEYSNKISVLKNANLSKSNIIKLLKTTKFGELILK